MKLCEILEGDVVDFPTTDQHKIDIEAHKLANEPYSDEKQPQEVVLDDYEAGKLTHDQAWDKIKKITPPDELFFWEMEFHAATDLMNDDDPAPESVKRARNRPSVVSRQQDATTNPAADARRQTFKVYRNETT